VEIKRAAVSAGGDPFEIYWRIICLLQRCIKQRTKKTSTWKTTKRKSI